MRTFWSNLPQVWRYVIVILLAAAFSVAGVWYAVEVHCAAEGVRGGGVAILLSLSFFSLRPDWGRKTYEARIAAIRMAAYPEGERLQRELQAVVQWLTINSNGQFHQNVALAIASAIGTFFWTFGDKIALRAMHWLAIHPNCCC